MISAAAVCPTSDAFRDYVNQATDMLMKRGNFWGTVQPLQVCVSNQCITWNRYVGTVLATNVCRSASRPQNNWSAFVPIGPMGIRGDGFGFGHGGCTGDLVLENVGTSPVFNQVACSKAFYVRAYPAVRADVGKKIRIFGIDSNGQTILTKNADGTWSEGVEITIAIEFASTTMLVREITRVVKEPTQGVVRLFQYDPVENVLVDCAVYDPSETNPDYRVSRLHGFVGRGCCNCSGVKSIKALVKLQFIKVQVDNDLVIIDNEDAIALAIQAIKAGESGKIAKSNGFEASAIHDLNLQLRDKFPLDQTPISYNPFGSAIPAGRAMIGRII
jgi:hypothetical protein